MSTANQLTRELTDLLPQNHPFLRKFKEGMDEVREEERSSGGRDLDQLRDAAEDLIDMVDDWKRNIRPWSEVDHKLADLKAKI